MSRTMTSTRGSGNTWDPTVDAEKNPKEEALPTDFLEGYYVGRKDGVGEYGATVITIETEEGERFDHFLRTSVKEEIAKVRYGTFIKIQWHGMKLKKAAKDKSPKQLKSTDYFHDFEVFVDWDGPLHPQFANGGGTGVAAQGTTNSTPATVGKAAPATNTPEPEFTGEAPEDDLPF